MFDLNWLYLKSILRSVAGLKLCALCAGYYALLKENRFNVLKRKCRVKCLNIQVIMYFFLKQITYHNIIFIEMNP